MTQDADAGQLVLAGALTMPEIEQVCSTLRAAVAGGDVAIDCRGAGEVDLGFVQLLLAARASAAATGRRVTLAAPPEGALLEVLTRAGFTAGPDGAGAGYWFA